MLPNKSVEQIYEFINLQKLLRHTLKTSRLSMNSVCISFLSHWFQELSRSTSSRLDGTSKSPIGGINVKRNIY